MKIKDSHVLAALQRRIKASSYRKVASELSVSAAYLHDVANGRRGLTDDLGTALGFLPDPPKPAPPRTWHYRATDAATTKWERKNWPQVPHA